MHVQKGIELTEPTDFDGWKSQATRGSRQLADITVIAIVIGGIGVSGISPLNFTDLLPQLLAAGSFLERERQIHHVRFRPYDQCLLEILDWSEGKRRNRKLTRLQMKFSPSWSRVACRVTSGAQRATKVTAYPSSFFCLLLVLAFLFTFSPIHFDFFAFSPNSYNMTDSVLEQIEMAEVFIGDGLTVAITAT